MKEHEIIIEDFEGMREILKNLGFKETGEYFKNRISYCIGKVNFELDTLPGVPTFLEIEAPTEKILERFVKKLGFSMKDAKSWTGNDVLKHYGKFK